MPAPEEVEQRLAGSLLGRAVSDALGRLAEGLSPAPPPDQPQTTVRYFRLGLLPRNLLFLFVVLGHELPRRLAPG